MAVSSVSNSSATDLAAQSGNNADLDSLIAYLVRKHV